MLHNWSTISTPGNWHWCNVWLCRARRHLITPIRRTIPSPPRSPSALPFQAHQAPPPAPLIPGNHESDSKMSFWECYVNAIIQYITAWDWLFKKHDSSSYACILQCVFPVFPRPTEAAFKKYPMCGDQPGQDHTHSADFRLGSTGPWSEMQNFIEHFSCRAIEKKKQGKKETHNPTQPTTIKTKHTMKHRDFDCKGRPGPASDGWRMSSAGGNGEPQRWPPKRQERKQQAAGCILFGYKGILFWLYIPYP